MIEPHVYEPRSGADWCRICGEDPSHTIHALEGMVRTPQGWAYPPKVEQTYPILKFFEYGHLSEDSQKVSRPFAELAQDMAAHLPHNAETAAGLRKLLEAKDCFVRAAL